MSVINSMLRKLDARGAERPDLGPVDAAARPLPMPARRAAPMRWRLPALVAIGGAAIGATAFADWPQALGLTGAARLPQPAQAVAAAADVVVAAPTAPTAPTAPAPGVLAAEPARPADTLPAAPRVPARAASTGAAALPATPAPPELAPPLPPRIDKRLAAATPAQRAAVLHRNAVEAAQSGHASAALAAAREALGADPAHQPSRLLAAMLEHEAGAIDRATALLRDGLARAPADPAPLALLLARLQAAADDGSGALATLDHYRLVDAPAQGLRAALHARAGAWRQAQDAYEGAARLEPANAAWWFGLGVALDAQSEGARARQAYARAQSIGLPREDQAGYAEQRLRALD